MIDIYQVRHLCHMYINSNTSPQTPELDYRILMYICIHTHTHTHTHGIMTH